MNASKHTLTIGLSIYYFIGIDGRFKYFPEGLASDEAIKRDMTPIGVSLIESSTTDSFFYQFFDLKAGVDLEAIIKLSWNNAILGAPPEEIEFDKVIFTHFRKLDEIIELLPDDFIVSGKTSNEPSLRVPSNHKLENLLEGTIEDYFDTDSFLKAANYIEYENAAFRWIKHEVDSFKSRQRTIENTQKIRFFPKPENWLRQDNQATYDTHDIVHILSRDGLFDTCRIGTGSRFNEEQSWQSEMFDEDDDNDNNEEEVRLLYQAMALLSCMDSDDDGILDSEYFWDVSFEEADIDPETTLYLQEIFSGHCIFAEVDSSSIFLPISLLDPIYCIELTIRNKSNLSTHLFMATDGDAFHIYIVPKRYFNNEIYEHLEENVDLITFQIKEATLKLILQILKHSATVSTMTASVTLIKQILIDKEREISEFFEE